MSGRTRSSGSRPAEDPSLDEATSISRVPPPAGPLSPGHPAALAAALVAAACILVSVSYRIDDPDVWQHLLVGRAIWEERSVPATHLWTWPSYGEPDVLPSWGFRAALWPFWSAVGPWGLFAWRWLTTLLAFGILWVAARRLGARGLGTLVILVLSALTYRLRTQVRPETLVAVLLALEIWVLEVRRARSGPPGTVAGGSAAWWRDPGIWVIPIAWVWANVHISYYLGLALLAIHLLDARLAGRRARRVLATRAARRPAEGLAGLRPAAAPSPRRLAWIGLAAAAVLFANPFGWRALWQPIEYYLHWRHEPIFQTIVELHPMMWSAHWKSGLPLLMLGWPALILWRARRRGFDLAETLTCALFTTLALSTQRFAGFYALVAAPYVARDLDAWIRGRRAPSWTRPAFARATLASAGCVFVGLLEWSRPEYPLGIGIDMSQYPVGACDFMAAHDVKGRGFNPYYVGGYLLWRFWPDRDRLPFMDIHQTGTIPDRLAYAYAFANESSWRELDRRHHFDYVLLEGRQEAVRGDRLLDFLDADTTWALVFRDDAGALFVRRSGSLRPVAERFSYFLVPGGEGRVPALLRVCQVDTLARRLARNELERQIAESPENARAHSLLATIAWIGGRSSEARDHLQAALDRDPETPTAHQRLGLLALSENRPLEALREFEAERALGNRSSDLNMLTARAYRRLGDLAAARSWYRRELKLNPGNIAARESLAVLEAGLAR